MHKIISLVILSGSALLLTACSFDIAPKQCKPPLIIAIEKPIEETYEQLGYCDLPVPKGHGVYYTRETGKCLPKIK